jgi:hypothetical protein
MLGVDYQNLLEEQYWLSKRANISVSETNDMAEFERGFFISLLHKDIQMETKEYQKATERMKTKKLA